MPGGVFPSIVAVVVIAAWSAIELIGENPMDQAQDLHRLPETLVFAAIAGMCLGGIAGLACQLTKGRVSFLTSTLLIGIWLVVAKLATRPRYKRVDTAAPFETMAVLIAAAVIGLLLVFLWTKIKGQFGGAPPPGTSPRGTSET
jgi:peptidoglycan/LPS O-acetylase OafA/YrhL